MRYICALLLLAAPLTLAAQKEKKAANTQVITGCLDEKADYYVIRSSAMKELASLEPVGFDKTLFAHFVGHWVSITGELVESSQPPTLRVKSYGAIKNLSDACIPPDGK